MRMSPSRICVLVVCVIVTVQCVFHMCHVEWLSSLSIYLPLSPISLSTTRIPPLRPHRIHQHSLRTVSDVHRELQPNSIHNGRTHHSQHPLRHEHSNIANGLNTTKNKVIFSSGSISELLIEHGGPLCQEEMDYRIVSRCPIMPCGEYNLWYDDVYRNSTPDTSSQIYRRSHYFNSIYNTTSRNSKVIVSLGHNGFGNQLFQHYFAQRLAEHLHIPMYMSTMSVGHLAPNTDTGSQWNELVADPVFLWDSLPSDHPARELCRENNFTYSKRPVDIRSRKGNDKLEFNDKLASFLDPEGSVRCMITLGYFQSKGTCIDTARKMWPSLAGGQYSPRILFEPTDMVMHLRCEQSHYGSPSVHYIGTILNGTRWDRLFVVKPSKCLGANKMLLRWILATYSNAEVVDDRNATGFNDFVLLMSANKLIEDRSTYSYWAGIFSNASEKHVYLPYHDINKYDPSYVYHSEKSYFGEYNHRTSKVMFSTHPVYHRQNITMHRNRTSLNMVHMLSNNTTTNPLPKRNFADILFSHGGPLCQEEMDYRIVSRCPIMPCGEYNLWYDDVYRNSTPDTSSQIYRRSHYFNSIYNTTSRNSKVIVSLGHNGFGNQLFQHYFAQRLAEHLHIPMYMSTMSVGHLAPNTDTGSQWNELVADPVFLWDSLPSDHPARELCRENNFTYSKRPVDIRSRKGNDKLEFNDKLASFLDPEGSVRCMITLGYFQSKGTCIDTARKMWPPLADSSSFVFNPRIVFNSTNIVLHMRCASSHYGVLGEKYIETILNGTKWDNLYIVKPPDCPGKSKAILNWLLQTFESASVVKSGSGIDDFILLITANKLIEDRSTFSYWAGIFSNATEKHVNLHFHDINRNDLNLVYHDSKKNQYFGRYNVSATDYTDMIIYPTVS